MQQRMQKADAFACCPKKSQMFRTWSRGKRHTSESGEDVKMVLCLGRTCMVPALLQWERASGGSGWVTHTQEYPGQIGLPRGGKRKIENTENSENDSFQSFLETAGTRVRNYVSSHGLYSIVGSSSKLNNPFNPQTSS